MFKPIRDIGLSKYLEETKAEHNGYGWHDFDLMVRSDVNPSNLGRVFNVHRQTIGHWLGIYKEEVGQPKTSG